jgi:Ca-activated chloride channel family protein
MRVVPFVLLSLICQAPRSATTFSSRSDLVVLHVSVIDRHSGFVGGLPREAFSVQENGRPQPIAFFEHEDTPVSVGLVIDNSGSMAPRRDAVIAAGLAFAESSHPADEMFTVNFNERVWPGLPEGRAFTSDHGELQTALSRAGSRGQTALFDAVDAALRHLDDGRQPRKVLLVVSDGGDNASRVTFQQVLDGALRRDVVIYTIGLSDPDDREAKPGLLKELARVTGGEAFFPRTNDEIAPALERIARDIRSSYTVGYTPPDGDRGPRKVHVDVRSAEHPGLSVRARSLYMSGAPR